MDWILVSLASALAGFVEPGETIEQAARREVFEEAGIRVGAMHGASILQRFSRGVRAAEAVHSVFQKDMRGGAVQA